MFDYLVENQQHADDRENLNEVKPQFVIEALRIKTVAARQASSLFSAELKVPACACVLQEDAKVYFVERRKPVWQGVNANKVTRV